MFRTDLALESAEIARGSAGELDGVVSETYTCDGVEVTDVRVVNDAGAAEVGKPVGRYMTLEVGDVRGERFGAAARALASAVREMIPLSGSILAAGLGNREVTPDALGPLATEHILVTRHLKAQLPEYFGGWRTVSAVAPGVTGVTGLDAIEILAGAVERVKPAAVVVIDALASRSASRLCTTVQLADSGIVPGSGVGNDRAALDERTLGVPVIAIGVPTVMDALSLAADVSGEACERAEYAEMFVTPRDIDRRVSDMAKLVGTALSMAAHGLSVEEALQFSANS